MKKSQGVKLFNWNHFEMRLLNLRIIFFYLLRTFCLHLGSFCVVFSSFTMFRPIFTSGLLQVIYRDRQQIWKAEMTGDTVTRLSTSIRGRGKSPEEGQRWNLAETYWKKKKQHKNYQNEDKKSAINKKINSQSKIM